jgi:hypothetical protein
MAGRERCSSSRLAKRRAGTDGVGSHFKGRREIAARRCLRPDWQRSRQLRPCWTRSTQLIERTASTSSVSEASSATGVATLGSSGTSC